jgi:predicted RNA methylase
MSLRNANTKGTDVMYTPPHAVNVLLDYLARRGLLGYGVECWECAAGAGHIAKVLAAKRLPVLATDVAPAATQVHPVLQGNFFNMAPSGQRCNIITNPPYGSQSRLIIAFIIRAFEVMENRHGCIAMLLPFEFDASTSRNHLVGEHPWFVGKVTVHKRIRWVNLQQSKNPPMGNHAWYIWHTSKRLREQARAAPTMVAA